MNQSINGRKIRKNTKRRSTKLNMRMYVDTYNRSKFQQKIVKKYMKVRRG